jgi:CheY-like chemotaxis protein
MNGIEFLEALRRMDYPNKQQIAIVLLTSSVSEKDKAYAMSLGVRQCLSKPLTQESLDAVVHSVYNTGAAPGDACMQVND